MWYDLEIMHVFFCQHEIKWYNSIRFNWTWFLTNSLTYRTNISVPSFLTVKTLIQNLCLTNIAFNEFLIISNTSISFFLKFYHEISEQYHIFELRSLFATFKSLKSVEFPTYAVVRNSNLKHFYSNASSFQITLQ